MKLETTDLRCLHQSPCRLKSKLVVPLSCFCYLVWRNHIILPQPVGSCKEPGSTLVQRHHIRADLLTAKAEGRLWKRAGNVFYIIPFPSPTHPMNAALSPLPVQTGSFSFPLESWFQKHKNKEIIFVPGMWGMSSLTRFTFLQNKYRNGVEAHCPGRVYDGPAGQKPFSECPLKTYWYARIVFPTSFFLDPGKNRTTVQIGSQSDHNTTIRTIIRIAELTLLWEAMWDWWHRL